VAQAVEDLLNKCEALNSNPRTSKKTQKTVSLNKQPATCTEHKTYQVLVKKKDAIIVIPSHPQIQAALPRDLCIAGG
jgi:hypothetical protein